MIEVSVREETPADTSAITEVLSRAYSGEGKEPEVVDKLRHADALALSLVAEHDGRIVGYLAVSPVTVSSGEEGWYAIGPVAVEPELQRQKIGTQLIKRASEIMEDRGAEGLTVVGEEVFFVRFGFLPIPFFYREGIPEENFLSVRLNAADYPDGEVTYHSAFTSL